MLKNKEKLEAEESKNSSLSKQISSQETRITLIKWRLLSSKDSLKKLKKEHEKKL